MTVDLSGLTFGEIYEYVGALEGQVRTLTKKTDNRKKFSRRDVEMMKRLSQDGRTHAEIADIFDCNRATVSRNVRGIYNPI